MEKESRYVKKDTSFNSLFHTQIPLLAVAQVLFTLYLDEVAVNRITTRLFKTNTPEYKQTNITSTKINKHFFS